MANALVPEFAVSDWRKSKRFYCEVLGFQSVYECEAGGTMRFVCFSSYSTHLEMTVN